MPNLTSTAATLRRGGYVYRTYASVVPYDIVLRGTVSATPTFPALAVAYTNISGSHTNVKLDQVVVFYDNTGRRKGSARVAQATVTNVSLPIEELAQGTINIVSGDTFTVFDAYELRTKIVSATASLLKDSRIALSDNTSNPPPIANCGGLWAGFTDAGQAYATVTFDASVSFTVDPDSSGTKTYLWAVGDGSITVGTTTTASITVQFPVGFRHITLTVTDSSNSKSTIRRVPVWVHNTTTYKPLSVVVSNLTSAFDRGWNASFELPVDQESSLDNLPDNSLVVLWETEHYNGAQASYGSNTSNRSHIKASLFLIRDSIQINPDNNTVTFEAVSPLTILEQTAALPQLLVSKASPAKWSEYRGLTVNKILDYLIRWHSSALTYFDFQWVSGTDLAYSRISVDGDSIAAQLRDVANSILVDVTCDHLGAIRLIRNPNYESSASRDARTVAYDLTTADLMTVELTREHRGTTKTVRGEGITSANKPVFSNAPGNAPSWMGTANDTLSKQIVASQTELNTRSGYHFANVNGLYDGQFVPKGVRITLPDGYGVFETAYREFVTLTLPATTNLREVAFTDDTRWTVENVDISYDADAGAKNITVTLNHETAGVAGVTYVPPPETSNGIISYPPFDVQFPNLPVDSAIDIDGNPVIPPGTTSGAFCEVWSEANAWLAENVLTLTEPAFGDNTPDTELVITDAAWEGVALYILANNSTNSYLFRSEDARGSDPVWTSTLVLDVWKNIRIGTVAGQIYLHSPGDGVWEEEVDFEIDDGGFAPDTTEGDSHGIYVEDVGWQHTDAVNTVAVPDGGYRMVYISKSFAAATITGVSFTYDLTKGTYDDNTRPALRILLDDVDFDSISFTAASDGTDLVHGWTGSESGVTKIGVWVRSSRDTTNPYSYSGSALIKSITISGTGTNPVGTASNVATIYSDDSGATFDTPLYLGTSPGTIGGLDTAKNGSAILVGEATYIKKAATGGSYADYGAALPGSFEPAAIHIPRRQLTTISTLNNATNPEFIMFSTVEDDDGETMYRVTAAGNTLFAITPEIGAVKGVAVSSNCLDMSWWSGRKIAVLALFGSDVHLITSIDTGATWVDRGIVNDDAKSVRFRRGDTTMQQLYIANGDDGLMVSLNFGAIKSNRLAPGSAELIGVAPFG